MTCDEAARSLPAFLAGRLDAGTSSEVDRHLAACAACRDAYAAQRDVSSLLASRASEAVPSEFSRQLAARLDQEDSWFGLADWRWLTVRVAPVAAALLVVAGVVAGRATASSSSAVPSLSGVVDTWATGESEQVPVTSVLWEPGVSDDSAMLAVLAAPADATIGRQSDDR